MQRDMAIHFRMEGGIRYGYEEKNSLNEGEKESVLQEKGRLMSTCSQLCPRKLWILAGLVGGQGAEPSIRVCNGHLESISNNARERIDLLIGIRWRQPNIK